MVYHRRYATELRRMAARDKTMRLAAHQGKGVWDPALDKKHTARLREIVEAIGWPTIPLVGKKASSAAWLIAQHADKDIAFQQHSLVLMRKAPLHSIDLTELAYLEDRVLVNEGKPQLYGTQFYVHDGTFQPRPISDREHLDQRRKSVGLKVFEDYEAEMQEFYGQ
jgi:hypothetical protein